MVRTPLKSRLPLYGEPLFKWKGRGQLHWPDGTTAGVQFTAVQTDTGDIVIETRGRGPLLGAPPSKLTGTANTGDPVEALRLQQSFTSTHWGSRNASIGYWYARRLTVVHRPRTRLASVTFGLVNFEVTENHGIGGSRTALLLQADGCDIFVAKAPAYQEAIARAKYQRSVGLTAEATLTSRRNIEYLVAVMNDVCSLLSLARGTMVNWIYYQVRDSHGNMIKSVHSRRITRGFSSVYLIEPHSIDATASFVEATFPLLRNDLLYDFGRAINGLLDARSGSFLEVRALAACMMVEYFVGRYGTTRPSSWRSKSLQWRLQDMNRSKKIGVHHATVRWFIKLRNSLAHRGRFLPRELPWRQYLRLLGVLDRLCVRLLSYRGPITNHLKVWDRS